MYCFFYVKKSRSSKAEQLYIQVNGIIILYWPILIGSLICGPRQPDHARWCVSYNVYRSVNFFFFHYSIMYYNMYCYHVASIHNQSWTGLLIMETVDQSVSCNLVGVFFFLYLKTKFYCATIWNKKFYDKFCYYVKVLTCIW